DSLSRTAAPVAITPAVQTTPAKANIRIAAGEGSNTAAAARPASVRAPGPGRRGCGVSWSGTGSMLLGGPAGRGTGQQAGRRGRDGLAAWPGRPGDGLAVWPGRRGDGRTAVGPGGDGLAAPYASGTWGSLAPREAPAQAIMTQPMASHSRTASDW